MLDNIRSDQHDEARRRHLPWCETTIRDAPQVLTRIRRIKPYAECICDHKFIVEHIDQEKLEAFLESGDGLCGRSA